MNLDPSLISTPFQVVSRSRSSGSLRSTVSSELGHAFQLLRHVPHALFGHGEFSLELFDLGGQHRVVTSLLGGRLGNHGGSKLDVPGSVYIDIGLLCRLGGIQFAIKL